MPDTPTPTPLSSRPARVFLVDDTEAIRERIVEELAAEPDFVVVGHAGSVATALTSIARADADIVILDLSLPDGNGIRVLEQLACVHPRPAVVVLTNHPHEDYRQRCLRLGAHAFLDKALEFSLLKTVLRAAWQRGHPAASRLLADLPGGALVVGADLVVTYANAAALQVLAILGNECVGRPFTDVVADEDAGRLRETWTTGSNEATAPQRMEIRLPGPRAGARWVEVTWVDRRTDPDIGGWLLSVRDASNNRAREQELEAMEDNLRLSLAASNTGLWDWNVQSGDVRFSSEWKGQLGYAERELQDRFEEWESRLHPSDRGVALTRVQEALEGTAPFYENEFRLQHRDGTWRWIYSRGAVSRDDEGLPLVMRGSHVDITAMRVAERALAASRELYRQRIEEAPEAMLLIEADGRIVEVNGRACELFGMDRDALKTASVLDAFPRHEHERVQGNLARLGDGRARTFRHRFHRRDGTRVEAESSARRLADGHTLVIVLDLGARAEREQRVRQSEKLRTIGELTSGIAHDFNNLLSVIIGNTDLLLDAATSPVVRAHSSDIRDAAMRGSAMIRRLLQFTRSSAFHLRRAELPPILGEFQRYLAVLLPGNIAVLGSCPEVMPPVMADPVALEQALLNLATNARDAMPGGGQLTIDASAVELSPAVASTLGVQPGRFARIIMSDTGIGMDETTRRRMFEPFFTTKPAERGTGLGMPSVLGVIRQHRGGVTVDSHPNEGTSVALYLPVATP